MDQLIPALGTAALVGSAVVGGIFFAFSSFVMRALGLLPPAEGIAAMKSINVVVINPSFMGVFMGSAAVAVGIVVLAFQGWGQPWAPLFVAGAVLYLVGTFGVTMVRNVPLNNELAATSPGEPGADATWSRYLKNWTFWNHVRTLAAVAAAVAYLLGLMRLSEM